MVSSLSSSTLKTGRENRNHPFQPVGCLKKDDYDFTFAQISKTPCFKTKDDDGDVNFTLKYLKGIMVSLRTRNPDFPTRECYRRHHHHLM